MLTLRPLFAATLALVALPACDAERVPPAPGAPAAPAEPPAEGPPIAWQSARHPATAAGGAATLYFTRPGTERGMGEDPEIDDALAEAIDAAEFSVDLCIYEFKRQLVYEAAVRAAERGVQVRFVGDGDEIEDSGYVALQAAGVELVVRPPKQRIMHNKFAVIDARRVFTGSMNYTDTGMEMNNNHTILLESEDAADLYAEEFQQMYDLAKFGPGKEPIAGARQFNLGDRPVEIYFSPEDRPINELRRALSTADHSVYFMVFAFTDKDLAGDLEALHAEGVEVVGVFDESQARGRYSVDERLAQAGLPVFIDGNHNNIGFAGGKLHHKVMLIDVGTDSDPIVVSGSFNWSNAANLYNDENLVIYRGADFALPFLEEFCKVLEVAVPHPEYVLEVPDPCAALRVSVRINEVLPNPDGTDTPEEYVELVNAGPSPMDLTDWTLGDLTNPVRHTFGEVVLQPGASVVVYGGANEAEPDRRLASSGGLSLNNSSETLTLRDATGTVIDQISWANAASGVAFNRAPDGAASGDAVVPHTDLSEAAMSPGRRVDGSLWPGQPMIVINEALPNPDGTDSGQEYVELVNAGTGVVDLAGWAFSDALGVRHEFDGPRLAPGDVLVLFDKGDHADVPNAINSTSGGLSLNNTGDTLTLTDAQGAVHAQVTYGSAVSGLAFNQAADGERTGLMVFHSLLDGAVGNQSPGLRADGEPWVPPPPALKVMINELLPNPAGTDAGNEYVELVNVGEAAVDLAGYSLGDATSTDRHVFPGDSVLAVGEALVLFDKGDHMGTPGAVTSSSGSLSLNNGGDQITLYRPDGTVMDGVAYDSSREGVALTREIDADVLTVLVDHDAAEGALGYKSPGLRNDGSSW